MLSGDMGEDSDLNNSKILTEILSIWSKSSKIGDNENLLVNIKIHKYSEK